MTIEAKLTFAKIAMRGAIAALSQPATFPADIAAARHWLEAAIKEAETEPTKELTPCN